MSNITISGAIISQITSTGKVVKEQKAGATEAPKSVTVEFDEQGNLSVLKIETPKIETLNVITCNYLKSEYKPGETYGPSPGGCPCGFPDVKANNVYTLNLNKGLITYSYNIDPQDKALLENPDPKKYDQKVKYLQSPGGFVAFKGAGPEGLKHFKKELQKMIAQAEAYYKANIKTLSPEEKTQLESAIEQLKAYYSSFKN